MAYFRVSRESTSTLTTPGYIYFAQGEAGGPIKIGWATDPEKRLAQLQAYSPVRLRLLHSEPGNGKEEAALHKQFAAQRQHGEWFAETMVLLDEIRARQCRNEPKAYAAAGEVRVLAEKPVWKPKLDPVDAPPAKPRDPYWEHGGGGWERLVKAAEALG